MTRISELHRRWSKDRDYKDACDARGRARLDQCPREVELLTEGLSQSQLAKPVHTTASDRLHANVF
jgi:hypothetical protein